MPLTTVFIPPAMDVVAAKQGVAMVYFSESGFVPSRQVRHARLDGVTAPAVPVTTKAVSPALGGILPQCSASQVFLLQEQGFVAMKVTVPPLFSQRGRLYSQLNLPKPFKVLSVVRAGEVLATSLEAQFVKAGDEVFILSQQPDAIRSQFFS